LDFLGKQWKNVFPQLMEDKADFSYEITYPSGKAVPCGDLRVARVRRAGKNLKFVLLHDRFDT
jgi:hypothetical protein